MLNQQTMINKAAPATMHAGKLTCSIDRRSNEVVRENGLKLCAPASRAAAGQQLRDEDAQCVIHWRKDKRASNGHLD